MNEKNNNEKMMVVAFHPVVSYDPNRMNIYVCVERDNDKPELCDRSFDVAAFTWRRDLRLDTPDAKRGMMMRMNRMGDTHYLFAVLHRGLAETFAVESDKLIIMPLDEYLNEHPDFKREYDRFMTSNADNGE